MSTMGGFAIRGAESQRDVGRQMPPYNLSVLRSYLTVIIGLMRKLLYSLRRCRVDAKNAT
jgi:hypothetical protein